MRALIIAPYASGVPEFPQDVQCSYQVNQLLLDNDNNIIAAVVAIDVEDSIGNRIQAKEWPTLDWIGKIDPDDGRYLNAAEAAARKAQNLFQVKLDVLTRDGFTDPVTGIKIKCTSDKVFNNWIAQGVFALMAKSVGASTGETPIETFDFNEQKVTLTMDQFFGLMLRMGNDFFAKFKQAAQ